MKKFATVIFFSAIALFCAANFARAGSSPILISEVLINGPGGKEFIELYNPTGDAVSMNGWVLNYYSKDRDWQNPYRKKYFPAGAIIGPGEFFVISIKTGDYVEESTWNLGYSTYQLNNADGSIAIFQDENFSKQTATDALGWGDTKVKLTDGLLAPAEKSLENISLSIENATWREGCEPGGTPGDGPVKCETEPAPSFDDTPGIPSDEGNDGNPQTCAASSNTVKLNEIFPWPESGNEFVEVKNIGNVCADVSGWKIMDNAGHKKEFPVNSKIEPGEYLILEGNLYLNNDSDTVYLLDGSGNNNAEALDSCFFEKAEKGLTYSIESGSWFWTSTTTPGTENIITMSTSKNNDNTGTGNTTMGENYSLSDKVYLSEIFPSPKNKADDEYIEIANNGQEPVDLYKWTLRDSSKTGKYIFKEHTVIEPSGFLVLYKSQSKIALNNSGESIYLYNPQNDLVSSVSYEKSSKGASYNFDGTGWRWSKYPTPGAKNKFDSAPQVKITKPKNVYRNISAEFSAKAKDKETKKLKFVWDFGDGKKSSLKKTTHKYTDTGKYTVTLSVSDDSQTIGKSFVINVKNPRQPNLAIVKIVPNPAGADSENEIVEIRNGSKKKISLKGWKIATGSGKMYNHPIDGGITVNSGETKVITRENSKFTLNNSSGKVQLVSPDGKPSDEVEYEKEKIAEDEAYEKIDGEWEWTSPDKQKESTNESDDSEEISVSEEDDADNNEDEEVGVVLGATTEDTAESALKNIYYTTEDFFVFLGALNIYQEEAPTNLCKSNDNYTSFGYLLASII